MYAYKDKIIYVSNKEVDSSSSKENVTTEAITEATTEVTTEVTTEATTENKELTEMLKDYKEYRKEVKASLGDTVMVTSLGVCGIFLIIGILFALLLNRHLRS